MSSAAPMQQAKSEAFVKTTDRSIQLAPQSDLMGATEHADLRTQASSQRQLQRAANHSQQSHEFKALQQVAQTNARATQLKSISAMMKTPSAQRVEDEEALQAKSVGAPVQREARSEESQTPRPNNTGLPDNLKSGIESLSGISMDHVKVHYNSSQPAQLNAHAYAQGSDIHVAPGQEQHLPHEAWHVVQQAQGRVKPTMQMKMGVPVNDDAGLEAEADVMGAKAAQLSAQNHSNEVVTWQANTTHRVSSGIPSQRMVIQRQAVEIDLEKVEAQDDGANIKLNEAYEPLLFPNYGDAKGKTGYIGTAIVWAGEKNAQELAKKYVEGSQSWTSEERKARLAVNFLINNREEFDTNKNASLQNETFSIAAATRSAVSDLATTAMSGVTWSYAYKGGNLPLMSTAEVADAIETNQHGADTYTWKIGADSVVDPSLIRGAFGKARAKKGVPYGALRSKVGSQTEKVENWLTQSNEAGEVYVHSIDADAPDFSTLSEKEDDSGEWLNILDAYDEMLKEGEGADIIIGGYNLTADREEFEGENAEEDYKHTVKSNVVDTAIRLAVFSIEPTMIYPTEPNFLIKASTYREVDRASGKKNVWGNRAFEGRNLMDNYIRMQSKKKAQSKIAYNPLASVPTGVGGGGSRLKITKDKKYDGDSIYGKPQGSSKVSGDTIGVDEQYVVQAQSWAGASRLASAYLPASLHKKVQVKKDAVIPLFAPIEKMALALAKGEDPASIKIDIEDVKSFDRGAGINMPIQPILERIQFALSALHKDKDFASIAPKVE